MYEQYLEKLKPKPVWNLNFYKNDDQYSEGDIENQVLRLIAENEPEDYTTAIYKNFSWSVYYHLTRTRKNILNWYNFKEDCEVLEIGCGFGAITGTLCEKCKHVTAVELSQRRAMGTLLRCREKENLEIIVGNLNDIQFTKKYDYITLIGVLEYQGKFTNSEHPYVDFLKKIKALLKPDGKLLIAIENQYGLKYWCGAEEDHTGVPFDGMNQYQFTNGGIRTFSKEALKRLVRESGFLNTYFYYPMPDYKLPTAIYSEKYLPKDESMHDIKYYSITKGKTLIADEKKLYKDMIENGVYEFFANSFLVECSEEKDLGEVIFACFSDLRQEAYQLGTRILNNQKVEKFALTKKGTAHIYQTYENEAMLKNRGLHTLGSRMVGEKLELPYTDAIPFEKLFVEACRKKEEETVIALIEKLYDEILRSSEFVPEEKNILYSLIPDINYEEGKYGPILKHGFLDMTFRNAFVIDDELYWYDQKWMLENIPADYMICRALLTIYISYEDINNRIPLEWIIYKCGLENTWKQFCQLENIFWSSIGDKMHQSASVVFTERNTEKCVENIRKIMGN